MSADPPARMTAPFPFFQLAGSAHKVVHKAAEYWDHRQSVESDQTADTLLWLRAGRACWLLGEHEQARVWYARAADDLTDLALGIGNEAGVYAYYAELALGAAVLAGRSAVLDRTAGAIRSWPLPPPVWRRPGRTLRLGDPTVAAQGLLRAWASWLTDDRRDAATSLLNVAGQVNALSPRGVERWQASRWPDIRAALEALLDEDGETLRRALETMDGRLAQVAWHAPTVSTWVDETLIAFAGQWRQRFPRSFSPERFQLPLSPGAGAPEPIGQDEAASRAER